MSNPNLVRRAANAVASIASRSIEPESNDDDEGATPAATAQPKKLTQQEYSPCYLPHH